ncbi:adenosylcobinamide-GDP ribazoletransferase [Psychromonas arctica]|uniref:adenosylcobinamide-GDP ribazoletransferase n=1 Tax=Psychromonas arctica TaxID=168275 RepID=UPI00041F4CAA|nr:adenosylcobinamide-GDP ribazoletransferase [Psychromonas arctica]
MTLFLKKQWVLFCYALSFFSRLPTSKQLDFTAYPFHLGNVYLPIIGLIYALICLLAYALSQLVFDPSISIILMLLTGVLLTGAFHEDGFADSCDGFGGGYNKQQRLAIMKDSQIGTYGVIGLILLLVLKIHVLGLLINHSISFFALSFISAAVLSRCSVLCLMQSTDYAREESSSKSTRSSQRLPQRYLLAALLTSAVSMLWMPFFCLLLVFTVVVISTIFCRTYFQTKIQGYTGDCLGFVQQLNELLILLMLVAYV